MKLLLKDCVKYVPYEYKNEVELENMVFEHYKEIFGEDSLLFSKKKIKSPAKIGTIPDAFVINFKSRRWFVVEVELTDLLPVTGEGLIRWNPRPLGWGGGQLMDSVLIPSISTFTRWYKCQVLLKYIVNTMKKSLSL